MILLQLLSFWLCGPRVLDTCCHRLHKCKATAWRHFDQTGDVRRGSKQSSRDHNNYVCARHAVAAMLPLTDFYLATWSFSKEELCKAGQKLIHPSKKLVLENYSGTLIIGPLLGRAKHGPISKVVTLSRWFKHEITKMGRPKSGLFLKVVWLSRWSHSKVPLYTLFWNKILSKTISPKFPIIYHRFEHDWYS